MIITETESLSQKTTDESATGINVINTKWIVLEVPLKTRVDLELRSLKLLFIDNFYWPLFFPDPLPKPTLVLQQHTDVWHLRCTGSPAYPGALFSLYPADQELYVAAQHAPIIQYQVIFSVPVQDTPLVLYQCDYKVLLEGRWSSSERSLPLAVTKGVDLLSGCKCDLF